MNELVFEWDERKARQNESKHGISFEDENARWSDDPDHSQDEDRYILLGISAVLRVLIVCDVYRQNDELIRIISARKATRQERQQSQRFSP